MYLPNLHCKKAQCKKCCKWFSLVFYGMKVDWLLRLVAAQVFCGGDKSPFKCRTSVQCLNTFGTILFFVLCIVANKMRALIVYLFVKYVSEDFWNSNFLTGFFSTNYPESVKAIRLCEFPSIPHMWNTVSKMSLTKCSNRRTLYPPNSWVHTILSSKRVDAAALIAQW